MGLFRMLWIPTVSKIRGDTCHICHNDFLVSFHPGLTGLTGKVLSVPSPGA